LSTYVNRFPHVAKLTEIAKLKSKINIKDQIETFKI
jgi:hypothetical protein